MLGEASPESPKDVAAKLGLQQIRDSDQLRQLCQEVLTGGKFVTIRLGDHEQCHGSSGVQGRQESPDEALGRAAHEGEQRQGRPEDGLELVEGDAELSVPQCAFHI